MKLNLCNHPRSSDLGKESHDKDKGMRHITRGNFAGEVNYEFLLCVLELFLSFEIFYTSNYQNWSKDSNFTIEKGSKILIRPIFFLSFFFFFWMFSLYLRKPTPEKSPLSMCCTHIVMINMERMPRNQGRNRHNFLRGQSHFSWFFFFFFPGLKCFFVGRKFPFWYTQNEFPSFSKVKKKSPHLFFITFPTYISNFPPSLLQFSFFSILSPFPFFPCLFFPDMSAKISRSEVSGGDPAPIPRAPENAGIEKYRQIYGALWKCVRFCVCVWGCVRMFMLSNEDTYMNFNLNTVDVPSNEDGPRSSDIGNDFNIT